MEIKQCDCCDEELNQKEVDYNMGLCFPCIKGNCERCGE